MAKTPTRQTDPAASPPAKRKPSFEEALTRLEAIVEQLDDGELPLERSLALFKEGRALAARCREMLEQAERDVKAALDERQAEAADDLSAEGLALDEEDGA